MMTLKSPPNLYAFPSPINMTTMIKQHANYPPTASSPKQTCSPGYSLPHIIHSITYLMVITAFDTYLTTSSLEAWYQGWVPRTSQAPSGV